MNLALDQVQISVPVFQKIREHLLTNKPPYRNMHMRQPCIRNGKRELLYLHAMHAPRSTSVVEGMICGPTVSLRYQMSMASQDRIQLEVEPRRLIPPKIDARLYDHFVPDIQARIRFEEKRGDHHPKPAPGQFYLRRSDPGMRRTHRTCLAAILSGTLDRDFVSQLYAWDLRLIRGRLR